MRNEIIEMEILSLRKHKYPDDLYAVNKLTENKTNCQSTKLESFLT